ncbi:MAG: hypothetical protein ACAH59_09010 [Pseudobdellovibrionaceae bacterium]
MGISKTFCLGLVLLSLGACSWQKKEEDLGSNSVKVQIPVSENGEYRLEVVELFTLENLTHLQGSAAQFLIDPDSVSGSLKGRHPEIRYIRDNQGVIVAKDSISLQLLTTYAHLEMLQKLDREAGAEKVLSYPRKVAINVAFQNQSESSKDNAFYSGKYDALLMVPFTQPTLPLMVNAGVIAHEHFHALFQKLVIEGLKEKYPENPQFSLHEEGLRIDAKDNKKRTKYHAVFMRGLNEGLADVWGWIYSGDNFFVGRSLPSEKADRELSVLPEQLKSSAEIREAVASGESDRSLLWRSYEQGTQLARTLRSFANQYAVREKRDINQLRLPLAQWIIATLPAIKKDFETLKEDEYLSMSRVVGLFANQVPTLSSKDCTFFSDLMPLGDQPEAFVKRCADLALQQKDPQP